jgi:hypothetical protein
VRTKDGQVILHLRVLGPRNQNILLVENMEHSSRFHLPRIVGEIPESNGATGKLVAASASSAEDLDLLTDYNTIPSASEAPANGQPALSKGSPANHAGGGK